MKLKKKDMAKLRDVARLVRYVDDYQIVSEELTEAQELALDTLYGLSRNGKGSITMSLGPLGLVTALAQYVDQLKEQIHNEYDKPETYNPQSGGEQACSEEAA